jgi:hypothetical protein
MSATKSETGWSGSLVPERKASLNALIHGGTLGGKPTPEYSAWSNMLQRCYNPKHTGYKYYGAQGVGVCVEWRQSFPAFLKDVGLRPSLRHSLDRYPNNKGNYEPGNVRWATITEQNRNTRSNRLITFQGVTRCVSEWEEVLGFPRHLVRFRLRNGWSVKTALTTPKRNRGKSLILDVRAALRHALGTQETPK